MKVSSTKIEPKFKPFSFKLTVESKEEAQALYAIFNHIKTTELLKSAQIRSAIGSEHYVYGGAVIANGISYNDFYLRQKNNLEALSDTSLSTSQATSLSG